MDLTNDLQDIDFEEQEQENETEIENQETESQTSIDRSITIDYYKRLIQSLSNRVNKIKEKLRHNRKIQLQFSMLLNKTVENQFGPIIEEPAIQKQAVPPLPPIHKESRTEIIRLIHSGTPSEVSSYFQKSNVISLLLFSDTSVFDQRLKESLMRSSPDIQVSFFNSTFQHVKKCGEFIDQMMPLLSRFSTDSLLRSQIYNSNSNFTDFYRNFYLQFLKSISDLIHIRTIKIVYTTSDHNSLIYPTENFFHIINLTNSSCSHLFKRKTVHMNSPQKNQSFEIVSEGPLFEDFTNIMSVKFTMSQPAPNTPAGAVIALSDDKFTSHNETSLQVVVNFFSPLLKLLRLLLLKASPNNFSRIAQTVAMMRTSGAKISDFSKRIGELCDATSCRILCTKKGDFFNEIPVVDIESDSIVSMAVLSGKAVSCINPRKNGHFNKEVDDHSQLQKIASMLVEPVNGTDFVFALYNSKIASEFTPVQRSVADFLSRALRPILSQFASRREVEMMEVEGGQKRGEIERAIEAVAPMAESVVGGRLFQCVNKLIEAPGESRSCFVFFRLADGEVMRFPGGDLVEVSDNLTITDFFYETDKFDLNIDVAGDSKVRHILVASSSTATAVITTTAASFSKSECSYLRCIASSLLMLAPLVYLDGCLYQAKEGHQLLRDSFHLSDSSFSRLISARVDLILFDKPVESEPDVDGASLIVSAETERGIEAAVAAFEGSREVKAASLAYTEWLTSLMSCKVMITKTIENRTIEIVSLFKECGILEVFKCDIEKLNKWVSSLLPLIEHCQINGLKFVRDLIVQKPWSNYFTQREVLCILLLSFLREVHKKWECKSDIKTVRLLKKCKGEVCAPIASIFLTSFGIADNLATEDCTDIIDSLRNFHSDSSIAACSRLLALVRSMSMRGFKKSKLCVKSIGQAAVYLSRCHFFISACDVSESLVAEFGCEGAKSELFECERVMLPILSFMSAKDEKLAKLSGDVRESILQTRKKLQ